MEHYQILLKDYYKRGKVDIDCIGIANFFFCAEAYPTCNGTTYVIE